jgi:hypothetical protein
MATGRQRHGRNVRGHQAGYSGKTRKEFDPKSVKQGIADPGLGRIARGAAAVGRAAYKAGPVRAVNLTQQAAKAEARAVSGVGARKKVRINDPMYRPGKPLTRQIQTRSGTGRAAPSNQPAVSAHRKATGGYNPTIKSNYPTGTGRAANIKDYPAAIASKPPKKIRPTTNPRKRSR